MRFKDRFEAGRLLAGKLGMYKGAKDTVIVAIPRGALQIGYALSEILRLPLDIVVTKKIPSPDNEEYAIGALAADGKVMLNAEVSAAYRIPESYISAIKEKLLLDISRRYKTYREDSQIPSFKGKTVILIDDGIATGYTMKAAIAYLRRDDVKKLVVAVPVSARDSAAEIKQQADEFVCLSRPVLFFAVGQFYDLFPQVSDDEAIKYLKSANQKLQI